MHHPPPIPADFLQGLPEEAWRGCGPELFRLARLAYDTPGRWYHGWPHIEQCLAAFAQVNASRRFDQPRAVLLALLFHDAVYVAGATDNESKSAALAGDCIVRHSDLPAAERERVQWLIKLTAKHHGQGLLDDDAAAFIDIDLSVLGADWPRYREFALGVRREFCAGAVTPEAYTAGRRRFLGAVLAQPHVFLTAGARRRLERQARANMAREMAEMLGPGGAPAG